MHTIFVGCGSSRGRRSRGRRSRGRRVCVPALTVTCQSDGLTQVSLSRTLPSITATEENDHDSNRVEPIQSMVIQAFLFLRFVCSFLFLVLSFKSPSGI